MSQTLLIESGASLLLEGGGKLVQEGLFVDLAVSPSLSSDLFSPQSHALSVDLVTQPSLAADIFLVRPLAAALSTIKAPQSLLTEAGEWLTTEVGDRLAEEEFDGPTVTAGLTTFINLTAAFTAETIFAPDLDLQRNLSAQIAAAATLAGSLSSQKPIYAALTSTAALAGSLNFNRPVAAAMTSSASLSPDLSVVRPLELAMEGVAALSGELDSNILLATEAQTQATLAADIYLVRALQAQWAAQGQLTASITTGKPVDAALRVSQTFIAALTTGIPLSASWSARSSMPRARLISQAFTPTFAGAVKTIYLLEVTAFDTDAQAPTTLVYSSHQGYDREGQWYAPRLENPATLARSVGASDMGGRAQMSVGEITLVNNDDGLDWSPYYFDGRDIVLKRGLENEPYAAFETVLIATMESVAKERERISIRIRDRSVTLDRPFSTVKYLGNNALPAGLEGTADDIKDQPKPRLFGRVALMQPVLVNTSKLIYQVNNGPVAGIINVFDAGAYLTPAAPYASESEMMAVEPAAGTWRAYPQTGYVRLGSSPFGTLSACVAESYDFSRISVAGVIKRLLAEIGMTDVVNDDFAALDALNAAPVGLIVEPDETTSSLLDRLCMSIGAWWGFDALNRLRVMRLDAPGGDPVFTLTDDCLTELERQPDSEKPIWQTRIQADRNYVVQDKQSMAGIVPDNRSSWFAQEYRTQKAESATTKGQRLLSTDTEFDSVLNGIAAAKAESARRLELLNGSRELLNCTVAGTDYPIDLGSVVNVQTSKLGYADGKLFTITSLAIDYQANTIDLVLFG